MTIHTLALIVGVILGAIVLTKGVKCIGLMLRTTVDVLDHTRMKKICKAMLADMQEGKLSDLTEEEFDEVMLFFERTRRAGQIRQVLLLAGKRILLTTDAICAKIKLIKI